MWLWIAPDGNEARGAPSGVAPLHFKWFFKIQNTQNTLFQNPRERQRFYKKHFHFFLDLTLFIIIIWHNDEDCNANARVAAVGNATGEPQCEDCEPQSEEYRAGIEASDGRKSSYRLALRQWSWEDKAEREAFGNHVFARKDTWKYNEKILPDER